MTDNEKFAWGVVATAIIYPLVLLSNGYVLVTTWGWFMVPLGLPTFQNIWHAIGAFALVAWGTNMVSPYATKEEASYIQKLLTALLTPWVFFVFAAFFAWMGGL